MYDSRIVELIKIVLNREVGIRESHGGEFDKGALYAYMEITQENPIMQLIYANFKKEVDLYDSERPYGHKNERNSET
jgi:hypothetical protein